MNQVYNRDWYEIALEIPDKSKDFIFIDPPYFKVKGDFDFELTFDEWIELHKKLARECFRILKDNGSIILWGHALKIAYQQIEFDKYFKLLNSCVWEKINGHGRKLEIEKQRTFATVTERFLFYDKGEDKSGLTMIYSNPDLFGPIKEYMREEKAKIKRDYEFKTEKEFNNFINKATDTKNVVSRHYFADSQYIFPTEEIYKKLQSIKSPKKKEYEYFKKEYEELRKEYEELRRPFNLSEKIKYDVMKWAQEDNITRLRNHPTQKPPGLVKEIVKTCCRINSEVFEPFQGTETLRAICHDFNFSYIGCEINKRFYEEQEKRFQEYKESDRLLFDRAEIQSLVYQQEDLI